MTTETSILNDHNKAEYPPMHTAEHILNQTMVRRYGCPRSRNAHIERKKSKVSYELPTCPSEAEVQEIVNAVNEVIQSALPVTVEYVTLENVPSEVSLEKLPSDVSEAIRLVRIGNFDVCACIGAHVANTSEIGTFVLLGTNWDEEKKSFRIRFKLA
jgi:Ser-tRNA(Ala) deacylase AlaX